MAVGLMRSIHLAHHGILRVEEELQLQAQLVEAMLASEGLHPPMTRQLLFPRRVL